MDFSPEDIEALLAGTASIQEVIVEHAISEFLPDLWDVLDSDSRASIVRDMACLGDDAEDQSATDSSDHDTDMSIQSDSDDGSTSSDSSSDGEDTNGAVADAAKKRAFTQRNTIPRENTQESTFFLRYIVPAQREDIMSNPYGIFGLEFRMMFRVPYVVFEKLIEITLAKGWYDPNRYDGSRRKCSDIRLLILGVLHVIGKAVHFNTLRPLTRQQNANSQDEDS
jgi:hypothetical protein